MHHQTYSPPLSESWIQGVNPVSNLLISIYHYGILLPPPFLDEEGLLILLFSEVDFFEEPCIGVRLLLPLLVGTRSRLSNGKASSPTGSRPWVKGCLIAGLLPPTKCFAVKFQDSSYLIDFLAFRIPALKWWAPCKKRVNENIARIPNAVQCHNWLSGKTDCLNSASQLSEL